MQPQTPHSANQMEEMDVAGPMHPFMGSVGSGVRPVISFPPSQDVLTSCQHYDLPAGHVPLSAVPTEDNPAAWNPVAYSPDDPSFAPANWVGDHTLHPTSAINTSTESNFVYGGSFQDNQEACQDVSFGNFQTQPGMVVATSMTSQWPMPNLPNAAAVPGALVQPPMLSPGNMAPVKFSSGPPAAVPGLMAPPQPRIPCTFGCSANFARNFDRIRHEDSVHGFNQALGRYLCHVPGCSKSLDAGFTRKDKLT